MEPTSGRDVIQTIRRAAPDVTTAVTLNDASAQAEDNFPGYLHPDASLVHPGSRNELEATLRKLGLLSHS